MCGIMGIVGGSNLSKKLLDGIKSLEYRGYDSVGMASISNNQIVIKKDVGRLDKVHKQLNFHSLKGNTGIAHCRWSTHGEPSQINAHPHSCCKEEVAIVHNGIIENHHALKELLTDEGHTLTSNTDSEIFAHLIEKFFEDNLEEAVTKAVSCVEGTFGLAVIQKDDNKLVVARRGSPLIIGVGDKEMFVASDASAIVGHTKKVVYLDDDEIAVLEKDNYDIRKLNGERTTKEVHEIQWSADQIEKSGFKHFMLKEIFEQPDAIENVLRGRIKRNKIKLTVDTDNIKRIILTACGTSWHSALIGKFLIEKITHIPTEVDYASEFRYRDPLISKDDLIIVISQSGETADTLAAIKEAKTKGAKTLGIVNVVGSTISREVDSGIYLHAGPEIGVASTKAFTSQLVSLLLLALHIRQTKGKDIDEDLIKELVELPKKIKQVLETSDEIRNIADSLKDHSNALYLGRGLNFPVALEGALKLKEISYIHAEGYPAAEMKHGPIALVDKDMPVFFIAAKDHTYEKILSNMEEIKARKGKIIAFVQEDDDQVKKLAEHIIKIPKTRDELAPILYAIPMQLLAYHIADLKNIDVDKPRNLAKSVTVE